MKNLEMFFSMGKTLLGKVLKIVLDFKFNLA